MRKFKVLFICLLVFTLVPTVGLSKSNLDVLKESLFGETVVMYGEQIVQMPKGDIQISQVRENIVNTAQMLTKYPSEAEHVKKEWSGVVNGKSFADADHVSHCPVCFRCAEYIKMNTRLELSKPQGVSSNKRSKLDTVKEILELVVRGMEAYKR